MTPFATELAEARSEITWLRNQMGDVRGMQSDGATPEEMDHALGRALAGERARQTFDMRRAGARAVMRHGEALRRLGEEEPEGSGPFGF